jgi:protein-S-isoprenylcysteine O-methyltransferase Ste14
LWAAYCALHSAMISPPVTDALKRGLGDAFRYYRLFFNAVAVSTLVPLVLWSTSIRGEPFFRWDGALRPFRYALLASGLALFVAGGRHYSLARFLGISQLRGASSGSLAAGGRIDSSGILGLVRHPWYTGVLLLIWAQDLDLARLVVNAVLTAYIFVGTRLEERKLVREFGEAYVAYRRRVSTFIPLKWLSRSRISP